MRRRQDNLAFGECRKCGQKFSFSPSQMKHYPNAGTFCSKECLNTISIGFCLICSEPTRGLRGRFCARHAKKAYLALDPISRRVWSMRAAVVKPGKDFIDKLLRAALGRPCPYCENALTLENVSLDHKSPLNRSRGKLHPIEVRRVADRLENLQIVCRSCNGSKGNFDDLEFRALMALPFWGKIKKRLAIAASSWKLR